MKQNNFYGIREMRNNPMHVVFKQKLAKLLLLHPDISGEEASSIALSTTRLFDANILVVSIEKQTFKMDPITHLEKFYKKMETWYLHHSLLTYEELLEVAAYFDKDPNSLLCGLKMIIPYVLSYKDIKRLELLNYLPMYDKYYCANELLDEYLDSKIEMTYEEFIAKMTRHLSKYNTH